ncbi:MAG: DNA polymerase III subunit delta' [Terriglobia bacterium]
MPRVFCASPKWLFDAGPGRASRFRLINGNQEIEAVQLRFSVICRCIVEPKYERQRRNGTEKRLGSISGNSLLVDTLRSQLAKGCVPHSLLFSGLPGLGKATLARFLAKALNCQNASADFCDQCSSCLKINSGTHPDVRLFQPDGQFIKIDSMRTLSRESRYHPFEGRRRVFILEEADRLNLEAANSILKTLEEPPESSVLILVTAKLNDLLPTIRSRCQLYRFAPLSLEEMEQLLCLAKRAVSPDRKLVSRLSAGSIGRR